MTKQTRIEEPSKGDYRLITEDMLESIRLSSAAKLESVDLDTKDGTASEATFDRVSKG